MENYAKVVLYAYPTLKTIGKEYEIHIANRALLSYKHGAPTEELAEYLAREIVCKGRLEWLKGVVDGVLAKLDETERALLSIRYFSASKSRRAKISEKENAASPYTEIAAWTDSKYFRRQSRVSEKVAAMLKGAGLTEEAFEKGFAFMDIFGRIARFVEAGRDGELQKRERGSAGGQPVSSGS